jgi:hypothetical protein
MAVYLLTEIVTIIPLDPGNAYTLKTNALSQASNG